jgi:transposase
MPVIRKHEKYYEEVRKLSASGMTDPEIAEKFGVARLTVHAWRKRYNIPPAVTHRKSRTAPHAETIIRMRKSGALYREIAEEIGVSESAVQKFVVRNMS